MKWLLFGLFCWGCILACHVSNQQEIRLYFERTSDTLCIKAYDFLVETLPEERFQGWTSHKELLIQDITLAVNCYREQNTYPFDLFCEYVLPIQVDNEPLENWRETCLNEFGYLQEFPIDSVCNVINNQLKNGFGFSLNTPSYVEMSWSQLDTLRKGDCFHMAKSVLYPLRALGYPVTIDFSPCWGNTTGAHAWNVIYIEGKMIPFMGREKGLYGYDPFRMYDYKDPKKMQVAQPYRYPAKVFRKTFSRNKELQNLMEHIPKTDLPAFMQDSRIKDVTAEYLPVTDVEINLNEAVYPDEQVYLAVYSDDWTITAWAEQKGNGRAYFKDMKRKMLYLPVVYRKGIIYPIEVPFIVDETGNKRKLEPTGRTEVCSVSYLLPLRQELTWAVANKDLLPKDIFDRLYNGEKRKRPEEGKAYTLYYWAENRWKHVETSQVSDGQLLFHQTPEGALLYLADEDGKFIGRCFTLETGEMVWW